MRRALALARLPALLTVALLAVVAAVPGRGGLALHVYVLLLAALALVHVLASLAASLPERRESPLDAALRPRPTRQPRVAELEQLEREVALGLTTAIDLHSRLRPTLRRVAAELLRSRRAIDLDGDAAAARRVLGEETWELVRPDREPPRERFGPGLDVGALRRVVGSLEAI